MSLTLLCTLRALEGINLIKIPHEIFLISEKKTSKPKKKMFNVFLSLPFNAQARESCKQLRTSARNSKMFMTEERKSFERKKNMIRMRNAILRMGRLRKCFFNRKFVGRNLEKYFSFKFVEFLMN